MPKAEDVLKKKRTVVDQIIDIFISPRKYMTKILLALLALSSINVIVSRGNSNLFAGYIVLIAICVIYLVVNRDCKNKRRFFMVSAVSIAALISFAVFFLISINNVGNVWLEEMSARLFFFSIAIPIMVIITYRGDEMKEKINESKKEIVVEE